MSNDLEKRVVIWVGKYMGETGTIISTNEDMAEIKLDNNQVIRTEMANCKPFEAGVATIDAVQDFQGNEVLPEMKITDFEDRDRDG